ncbi:WG repeat-containing protein [Polaribacter cellanae]|uniref:WG repeat-containing protein n=1 Tax=Polaribacter cellanae TaxID=2818493 RepID=A0A975H804_9FLAO|nr:WG repeat-containing protein [Polaribacter cellanae]QTE21075.1 WG repeat-containing protein [Polaribacter cellanae]
MIRKTVFFSLFFMAFQLHSIAQEIKDKDFPTNIEINALLKKTPKDSRRLPMSFNLTNSGTVKKLTNIGNAEKLNIDNNGGIVNQNFVFITLDNKTFFAPEKSEFFRREYFEKMFNLQTKVNENFDAFDEKIEQWEKRLELYAKELKKISNNDPRKKEGFEVLKNYKKNIDIATNLSKDFSKETRVVEDDKGNKNYLFKIENLKNDPRYFFIGDVFEDFSVAKKFNKYGYISHSEKFNDIPFKYDSCTDFKYNYAIVTEQNFSHIIDKKGNEVYTFETSKFVEITSVGIGFFLVIDKKDAISYDYDYYFINNLGEIVTRKYKSIEPLNDSKKHFKGTYYTPSNSKNKKTGVMEKSEDLISNKGEVLSLSKFDCSKYFPENKSKFCFVKILNIIELPKTNKLLFICKLGSQKEPSFILLNDLPQKNIYQKTSISKIIKNYSNVSFSNIKNTIFSSPKSNKNILLEMSFSKKKIEFIHIENDTILERSYRFLGIVNKKTFKIDNPIDIKRKTIYNFSKNKIIGKDYFDISKVNYFKELIFISDKISYNIQDKIAFGIMNFNGLYLIPPIFKEIKFMESHNILEVLNFNNSKYIIDTNGACIENCKEYNLIIKKYYTPSKRIWSDPIPFKG